VQTLSDIELEKVGRIHTASQAIQAVEQAQKSGFKNISADLILGLPGQDWQSLMVNLETIIGLGIQHLSLYCLSIEPHTPLALFLPPDLPSDDQQAELYDNATELFRRRGFVHYEISNFAKGREYRSRHNSKYWNHTPCLGLGPAAHSYKDGRRWWNHRGLQEYCQALSKGEAPVAGEESLTSEQRRLEALYLGMRTREGVPLNMAREGQPNPAMLQEIVRAGLAEVRGNRLVPTREGLVVADRLALGFVQ